MLNNVYLVSKMEKIDYMLVKLLGLVLLSIWNCNGNITTCNESVESKVCFLVNKVKNLCFSPLSDSTRNQQCIASTDKTVSRLSRHRFSKTNKQTNSFFFALKRILYSRSNSVCSCLGKSTEHRKLPFCLRFYLTFRLA